MERRDNEKQDWCLNYIFTMRALAKRKIDEITAKSMLNCDEHLARKPEPVTSTTKLGKGDIAPEYQKDAYIITEREDLRVGLWINHENT